MAETSKGDAKPLSVREFLDIRLRELREAQRSTTAAYEAQLALIAESIARSEEELKTLAPEAEERIDAFLAGPGMVDFVAYIRRKDAGRK
ncbi:MAG: hypothetical protein ABL982_03530 [Vicinamibacterales bacterium]